MSLRPPHTDLENDRTAALHAMLRAAVRDRDVVHPGRAFAFSTHRGKVRKDNQDAALVLAGRRGTSGEPYLSAVLCDGMGGLEQGAEAADLAAAVIGNVMMKDVPFAPPARTERALRAANEALFARFQGKSGTVVATVLVEAGAVVVGWLGDARVYGLARGADPQLLTRDDTVASEVARIEGAAPDAMDTLLRAVGVKSSVEPHVLTVSQGYLSLLLVSDGVHRMDFSALAWTYRHARNPAELVQRLVMASHWEGGLDNATAVALTLAPRDWVDEKGDVAAAWVEAQPRVWQTVHAAAVGTAPTVPTPTAKSSPETQKRPRNKSKGQTASRTATNPRVDSSFPFRDEQAPLLIEVGGAKKVEP